MSLECAFFIRGDGLSRVSNLTRINLPRTGLRTLVEIRVIVRNERSDFEKKIVVFLDAECKQNYIARPIVRRIFPSFNREKMIEVEKRRRKRRKKKTNCYSQKLTNDDELEESKCAELRKKCNDFCEKYPLQIMEL